MYLVVNWENTPNTTALKKNMFRLPNPFEKGDRVQLIGTDLIGTVAVSQEDWKKYVGKALAPNAVEDWVDASITVRYPWDKWSHDHINPMFLSKVKELSVTNSCITKGQS